MTRRSHDDDFAPSNCDDFAPSNCDDFAPSNCDDYFPSNSIRSLTATDCMSQFLYLSKTRLALWLTVFVALGATGCSQFGRTNQPQPFAAKHQPVAGADQAAVPNPTLTQPTEIATANSSVATPNQPLAMPSAGPKSMVGTPSFTTSSFTVPPATKPNAPSTATAQVTYTTSDTALDRYIARQFPNTQGTTSYPPDPSVTSVPGALTNPYETVDPYAIFPGPRERTADLELSGYPARTGRIMFGGAVNSDAGVTGQITVDERNFDITRWPTSFRDLFSGTAFRGRGQTLRLEAAPGSDFQRYMATFVEPSIFNRPISMSVSGFLFDRRFNDWDENRLGGRLAFGYRITPDLSISAGVSGQEVDITGERTPSPPQLTDALGGKELYGGEISLKHDTRNSPILASRGHYFEFRFEEIFGDYDYARFETEFRQYWTLAERADGSGKQTLSYSTQLGFSGADTPIFENYFAGGYATIRGFDFRGAGPIDPVTGVELGGRFQWLNSLEYMFPITADDAFRGVAFVDFGTVEQDIEIDPDNFRVAPGLGLRVAIPMLGPAPLAFDFAYPVAKAETDRERVFSFYMSVIR